MEPISKTTNELFSDTDFLIDQLSNSMEYYSKNDFVEFMGSELNMTPKVSKDIFDGYWELSAMDRMMNGIGDWKVFLTKFVCT